MISDWPRRWEALRAACAQHHATGRWLAGASEPPRFEVDPPATEAEILEVEESLGLSLPASFRRVLLTYSGRVTIEWQLPDAVEPPFRQIWAGECRWSLHDLPRLAEERRNWIDIVFPNPDDPYDVVWHNKLPFLEVGNGDMIAIDLTQGDFQPVVYLSHDDGAGHGYWMGRDFEDYVDRLSLIGCVGAEDWQWMPYFTDGPRSFLQPDSQNAKLWREWFGLHFRE